MTTKHLTGAYASGYGVSAPTNKLVVDPSGYVGGKGVYTPLADTGAYSIVNGGRIVAAEVSGYHGVSLRHGGAVTNQTSAVIQGYGGVSITGAAGSVTNFGTVLGTAVKGAGTAGDGVYLGAGGKVTNGDHHDTTALIQGYHGVEVDGGAGAVANYGTVVGYSAGVALYDGGALTNGTQHDTSALIEGGGPLGNAVAIRNAAGTVANFGTVSGGNIALYDGGTVTNGSKHDTSALIEGASAGVGTSGGAGTIANYGAITGTIGVFLLGGGVVTNGSKSDASALIQGNAFSGVAVYYGRVGTVTNYGTVSGGDWGVLLSGGGVVTNGSNADTGALIQGGFPLTGVAVYGGVGTVANYGTVTGGRAGVLLGAGGAVTNGGAGDTTALIRTGGLAGVYIVGGAGTVTNVGTVAGGGSGVFLYAGGSVTNGSARDTTALISGGEGVFIDPTGAGNSAATVTNFGTITGRDTGVFLGGGGAVINVGTITGGNYGVTLVGGALINGSNGDTSALIKANYSFGVYGGAGATVTNFGTITGYSGGVLGRNGWSLTNGGQSDTAALISSPNNGVDDAGGAVANYATITGGNVGVGLYGYAANTVTNGSARDRNALISGGVGVKAGAYDYAAATITNFGTIAGTGGVAVQFTSAADVLVVEAGSAFVGQVLGAGGTLELGAGWGILSTAQVAGGMNETVSGSMAPTLFTNFATVQADAGTFFRVTGDGVIGAGQSLIAAGGAFLFGQAITGSGSIVAGADGTLVVGASAASTLSMNFTGADARLALASPSTFAATIGGFAATDVIDLLGIKTTSATLGAGDVLTIMDGSHLVATLQLAGTYTGDSFKAAKDHHGGTDITTNAPGVWATPASPAAATSGSQGPTKIVHPGLATHNFIQSMAGFGAGASASAIAGADFQHFQLPSLAAPKLTKLGG